MKNAVQSQVLASSSETSSAVCAVLPPIVTHVIQLYSTACMPCCAGSPARQRCAAWRCQGLRQRRRQQRQDSAKGQLGEADEGGAHGGRVGAHPGGHRQRQPI